MSFIVVLFVTLLGLTACGSSTEEASSDGVDREGIHRDLISEAGRFFSHTLGQSTRAGMQTADQ